jgi:methyl-accepting chemotaxis protein
VLDTLAKTTDSKQVTKIRESAKVLHASVTKANKIITQLHASSTLLTKESKDISHKVAAVIDENNSNIVMVASEMAASTKQIEADVQTAVKSLQFQDMTTQLIVQCDERMKVMQDMLSAVHSIGSTTQNSSSDLQAKLNVARDMLKQASNVRMKQFNVDAGHVELFD